MGSGPTVDLAARLPRLRAVVLHSPILSGLRVMYPVKRSYWFDIYKVNICFLVFLNIMSYVLKSIHASAKPLNMASLKFVQNVDKIPLVKCPTLVIHVSIIVLYLVFLNYENLFPVFSPFMKLPE